MAFDPTILDGKTTKGLALNKTNWALDTLSCLPCHNFNGSLKVDSNGCVLSENDTPINGLYAVARWWAANFLDINNLRDSVWTSGWNRSRKRLSEISLVFPERNKMRIKLYPTASTNPSDNRGPRAADYALLTPTPLEQDPKLIA